MTRNLIAIVASIFILSILLLFVVFLVFGPAIAMSPVRLFRPNSIEKAKTYDLLVVLLRPEVRSVTIGQHTYILDDWWITKEVIAPSTSYPFVPKWHLSGKLLINRPWSFRLPDRFIDVSFDQSSFEENASTLTLKKGMNLTELVIHFRSKDGKTEVIVPYRAVE